jgi:hypothetical protein
MGELNKLEHAVLERLSDKYPKIKKHIPYLRVRNREITGVGMFVNFYYLNENNIELLDIPDSSISTNENIGIQNLKYGLGYEVDVSKGKINFIEFITYGENWNGIVSDFLIRG